MFTTKSLGIAAMLLFSAGSSAMLAQSNAARGNCPNPGQNCPRNGSGQCIRAGGGAGSAAQGTPAPRQGAGRRGGMGNCPRR